jgi:glycosyltransferase involved in cell wall biosynthesis
MGVLRACLQFRPDIVHLNQSGVYGVALPAAALLRLPIVAHVRLFEDAQYLAARRPNPERLRAIIAVSGAIEQEIHRFEALNQIPVHFLYDAYASAGPLMPGGRATRAVRRIACVGRIAPVKGQDLLIAAWPLVRRANQDAECVIVGDGDIAFVEQLKARTSAEDSDKITWAGFIEDVRSLLEGCAALACPSHREPLGRVVLESWDAGAVPVVYAGSGGAAEIVADARAGILYEQQTPESLADALRRALDLDPHESDGMIERGRSWISTHCDPRAYGEALVSRFAEIRG